MLVVAGGPVGAAAVAEFDLAALEVPEELLPFGFGRRAVFLGRPQVAAAGDEGTVGCDRLVGVDGLWRSQISEPSE